jgi:tetratricopeptide (TPR) repeat protein
MTVAAVDLLLREAAELYNAGRPEPAGTLCSEILTARPDHLPALHLAAVIAFAGGRMAEGTALLDRLFTLNPDYVPALITLGDALAVKGQHDGAVAALRRASALRPMDAGLHAKLGVAFSDSARFADAESCYRHALELDPELVQTRFNLAIALMKQDRLTEADEAYRAVIARNPRHHGAWLNLGNVLADLNRREDAVDAYHQALASPQGADAANASMTLVNLAACLCDLGRFDEAVDACERAIALTPDHAPAHTNLGAALDAQGEFEAAVAAHRRAVAADPAYAKARANLAVALRTVGRLDEAFAASRQAAALAPTEPEVRFNHAHALLMNGQLARGFDELRWGKMCKPWAGGYPAFTQPEWNGQPFPDRTLLLFAEAGLGDTLQFARYLPMAAARGGAVVAQVQPTLVPLLGSMEGVTVIPHGETPPPFDLQLPLMRLAHVFGTTLDSIPAEVPYLRADPAKVAAWGRTLGIGPSLKVGVVWAGNPRHKGDRHRSLPAEAVLPRLVMPGVQLYSLQKEPRPTDMPVLSALRSDIIDLSSMLDDFSDTAAAVAALDLIIAVDTSVAHLAGAMGQPVWLLLPHALDWRWLRDREDSPWYPSMRLFRQGRPQAWEGVLTRVAAALRALT